jgi:hypothetical protein
VRKIVLFALIAYFVMASMALADEPMNKPADKPKYTTNTVYFDKVTAKPGDHFAVKVYMFNTDTLSGCQIPIFYRSDKINLLCDSISVVGSRCDYFMFQDIKIPQTAEDDKIAYFSYIDTIDPKTFIDPLLPGDGLLATIYFTAPKDCPEGVVKLTRGMIPHPYISFIFSAWTPHGEEVNATFEESEITIKK